MEFRPQAIAMTLKLNENEGEDASATNLAQ
jgi:hypothetical protein